MSSAVAAAVHKYWVLVKMSIKSRITANTRVHQSQNKFEESPEDHTPKVVTSRTAQFI